MKKKISVDAIETFFKYKSLDIIRSEACMGVHFLKRNLHFFGFTAMDYTKNTFSARKTARGREKLWKRPVTFSCFVCFFSFGVDVCGE